MTRRIVDEPAKTVLIEMPWNLISARVSIDATIATIVVSMAGRRTVR